MLKKNNFIFLMLIISLFLVGCQNLNIDTEILELRSDIDDDIEKEADIGGSLTLPLGNINTLNPIVSENKSYYYFSKLIYEPLFDFDENFNLENVLVENYYIDSGGSRIEINLRDDVYWHDGEKLKAEDVIFTLEAIKAAGVNNIYGDMLNNSLGSLSPININHAIKAGGGGNKLYIEFDKPYGNNLEVLTFPILPSHRYETVGQALETENFKPIGTGPFKYESFTKLKEVKLLVNEDYHKGRPYLDNVVGKIYKDEEGLLRSFETGQVDLAISDGTDWEKYGSSDRMDILEYTSTNYEFLGFNFRNKQFKDEDGKHLRKAIMYAIDRDKIIDKLYLNHASKVDLPLHPDSWLNNGDLIFYGYDLNAALRELENTSYQSRDEEGFLLDERGNRLTLNLLTNTYNPYRYKLADSIRQDLEAIGIELIILPGKPEKNVYSDEEIDQQWDQIEAEILRGNYHMVLSGWDLSIIPDMSFIFHSQNRKGDNFISYRDEEMDGLLEEAFLSGSSRDKKKKAYENLGMHVIDELPYASLFYKNKALIKGKNVYGDLSPIASNPYRGIENIYVNYK